MKGASWLNVIVGVWLMFSPTVLHLGSGLSSGNAVTFGSVTIIVAGISLAVRPTNYVPAWINLAIGVWMFFSPWALGYTVVNAAVWNALIVGLLIAVFSVARLSGPRVPTARAA